MTRSGNFSSCSCSRGALLGLLALGGAMGCGEKPARIDVSKATTAFSAPVLSADPVPLEADVLGDSGKVIPGVALAWSAIPAEVATVADGALRCLKAGDATVVVAGGGLSETLTARCRIVAKIQAPDTVALVIGDLPTALSLSALDPEGTALADVPVEVYPADAAVAEVAGPAVRGLAVGRTTLDLKAGAQTLRVPVTVMKRVQTDTLALADGGSVALTLSPGRYMVEIHVTAADKSAHGVTVGGAGGGCPSREEATDHSLTCDVVTPSTVVITNPSALGMGPAELGNFSVYQVP